MQSRIGFKGLDAYPGEYIGIVKLAFKLEDLKKIGRMWPKYWKEILWTH